MFLFQGCGSGNFIVTPNGSRVNGYVPFKNGMKNGHIANGHMTTFVGYPDLGNTEVRIKFCLSVCNRYSFFVC